LILKIHINPERYRVAGWRLTKYGNKLCNEWKKRRDWLIEYVEDEEWSCGGKWEQIKYKWVNRAYKLRKILDEAYEDKWDPEYIKNNVDTLLYECDSDKFYKK
jgi:hypothetical protein